VLFTSVIILIMNTTGNSKNNLFIQLFAITIMQIEETLGQKTITRSSTDPYYTSLEFMRRLSESGKIIERENSYSTDGPFHRSDVVFDVIQHLDNYTSMKLTFYLTGENSTRNFLRLDIVASFVSQVDEHGTFTEWFAEFYLENVFPIMRKTAENKIKSMIDMSEAIMQKV
jgi:hypothetical protein